MPLTAGEPTWHPRTWKVEHGLPSNAVECLLQSHDGYLWIGTRAGLARFDGDSFETFDGKTPGFTDDACLDLAEDAEGALWIATKRGLYCRRLGRFVRYGTTNGLPHDSVRRVQTADQGKVLWITGPGGLARWEAGQFVIPTRPPANASDASSISDWPDAESLFSDRDGSLWIGGPTGLFRHAPRLGRLHREWSDETAPPGAPSGLVRCILRGGSGDLWFGTDHHLHRRFNGQTTRFEFPECIGDPRLRRLFEDRAGTMWVVCGGLLYRASEDGLARFEDLPELGGLFVSDVLVDAEDNLWVGTRYGGLRQLRQARLRVLTTSDGLPHNTVRSVARAPSDARLWIATAGGLAVVRDQQVRLVTDPDRRLPTNLQLAFEDHARRLWITDISGHAECYQWSANGLRRLPAGALAGGARAAVEDRLGRLWFGTAAGLRCAVTDPAMQVGPVYPNESGIGSWIEWWLFQSDATRLHQGTAVWTLGTNQWSYDGLFQTNFSPRAIAGSDRLTSRSPLPLEPPLPDSEIRCIAEDALGNLWWGTRSGRLHRLSHGNLDPNPTGDSLAFEILHTILPDPEIPGSLWIGSESGLSRFDNGQWHRFTAPQGLPEGPVHQVVRDTDGDLWLATSRGLFRCSATDLRSVAAGRTGPVQGLLLGEADGLLNANLDNTSQPGAALDDHGLLWFATSQGLAVVDPRHARLNRRPPPLAIRELRSVAGTHPVLNGSLHLPPGSGRRLEVSYTALSFVAPERNRFRFRLEGHDPDWIEAGTRRIAYYTNLRPGSYAFRVIGCNEDGVWNSTGARLDFTIAPFVHETLWFLSLLAAAVLSLASVVYRLHLRAARAEERAEIARSMHDHLAGKLAALAKAAETSDRQTAPALTAVAELARSALRTLRQSISLNDARADNLEGLVNQIVQIAEETLLPMDLRLRLDVPIEVPRRPIPARFREQVVLIANEAINNILKHAQASSVGIRLGIAHRVLVLEISDDGRGIPEGTRHAHPEGGLAHMEDRAQRLRARLEFHSPPPGGTSVRLTVPLP